MGSGLRWFGIWEFMFFGSFRSTGGKSGIWVPKLGENLIWTEVGIRLIECRGWFPKNRLKGKEYAVGSSKDSARDGGGFFVRFRCGRACNYTEYFA